MIRNSNCQIMLLEKKNNKLWRGACLRAPYIHHVSIHSNVCSESVAIIGLHSLLCDKFHDSAAPVLSWKTSPMNNESWTTKNLKFIFTWYIYFFAHLINAQELVNYEFWNTLLNIPIEDNKQAAIITDPKSPHSLWNGSLAVIKLALHHLRMTQNRIFCPDFTLFLKAN